MCSPCTSALWVMRLIDQDMSAHVNCHSALSDQESLHQSPRCSVTVRCQKLRSRSALVCIISCGQGLAAFTRLRLNNYKTIKTGQWDGHGMAGKCENSAPAPGSMQNVRCSVSPGQAPGRSPCIIKSGHPREHWREELFVSQNVPWVRIPGSCWHTRNTWKGRCWCWYNDGYIWLWWWHQRRVLTPVLSGFMVVGVLRFKFQ